MRKIVAALGGNALGNTPQEQKEKVKLAAKTLADLIQGGNKVIITHGNGPQVGMISNGLNYSAANNIIKAEVPLCECGAMSQGYIGYHLQNALEKELVGRGLSANVVTVLTEVEVDKNDPAFKNPTKPVGFFFPEEEAKKKMAENPELIFKEDAGRGWRIVVPSPNPKDIVQKDGIKTLSDSGYAVIACGGGGIPVVKISEGIYEGVDAVIDKDYVSERLAETIGADILLILTAVSEVCINFGKENESKLSKMNIEDAERYIAEGQFTPGSMLPKVNAALRFVKSNAEGKAIICSLDNATASILGKSGTVVANN